MNKITGQEQNWAGRIGRTAALAVVLSFSSSAQTLIALEQLHSDAASAKTTAQHATVAKQYRLHADSFAAKAAEHEKAARELQRVSGAAVIKWPGLASGQLQKAKSEALEARRAERETRDLADRHLRLAVEAQASGNSNLAGE